MSLYIGIDLGGTKIAGVVWDAEALKVRAQKTIPTQAHSGPDAVLERIGGLVCELAHNQEISGVAVGVPATFDAEAGVIWLIPNLPGDWYGKPVIAILRKMFNYPLTLV